MAAYRKGLNLAAIASLLIVLTMSLLVTRIAAMALMLTGMSQEAARFQARSAFTGVGFRQKQVELKKGPKAKQWLLVVDGKEYDLGKKASFTTAERKLATMR